MALLFLSPDDPAEAWRAALVAEMPELEVRIWPELGDPKDLDVALIWRPPSNALAPCVNLKAILSLGAGVDGLLADPSLPAVPLARMVDPSLTRTMAEYVLLAVLRYHREFDRYQRDQAAGRWGFALPAQAAERRVGVMGLGELGRAAAAALASHGFQVAGWSQRPKQLPGVRSFAGPTELPAFLAESEILVCLLPLTAATRGILNAQLFHALPQGARLINVGRGEHLVAVDLLAALDQGQLGGATLDVFQKEPLPPADPLWRHPLVLVTPHVASYCWPATAAPGVIANVRRALAGQPLLHGVERRRGY